MTVSKQLIDNVNKIKTTLNEISVYNLDVKTAIELYYELAKKVNEVINELSRFEGVVSDEVIKQNEKLIYLLGEGLKVQVGLKIDELIKDGTIQDLINNKIFNDLNNKIDTFKQEVNEHFNTKANKDEVFNMANMGQDIKEAMTGGSVAVVGSEMVNYINLNSNAVKRDILNDEIFEDKTVKTYNANFTNSFVSSSINYFPTSVLVTLNSSQLIENVTIYCKIRNKSGITKVQPRVESASTVIQGSEVSFTNACEIKQTIAVNKTSDKARVYLFASGSGTTGEYEIIGLDIYVNGVKSIIKTLSDLAVSFGTGAITSSIKTYKAVASKEYVQSLVNNSDWSNSKLIIYGDSISDDDFFTTKSHYYDFIREKTGIVTESYAVGGSGYAYNSTVTQSISKWGATNNMLHQIDNYGTGSPKFVIVECGTNDWGFTAYDLGTIADILDESSTTFYGYVGKACRKLKTKFPYSKILFMTLLPRYDVTNYMQDKVNGKGNTMKQYSQAIKDVCEAYSINVLDMYAKSQLYNPDIQPLWWYDRLHPSEKYHEEVFCDLVLNALKEL